MDFYKSKNKFRKICRNHYWSSINNDLNSAFFNINGATEVFGKYSISTVNNNANLIWPQRCQFASASSGTINGLSTNIYETNNPFGSTMITTPYKCTFDKSLGTNEPINI